MLGPDKIPEFAVERFRVIVRLNLAGKLPEALVLRLILDLAAGRRLLVRQVQYRPYFKRTYHEPYWVLSPSGSPIHARDICRSFSDHARSNLFSLGAPSIPAIPRGAALLVCSAFATDLCSRFAADLLLAKTENRGFSPRTAKIRCGFAADAAKTVWSARISAGSDGLHSAPGSGVRAAGPGLRRCPPIGLNEMALGRTLGLTT